MRRGDIWTVSGAFADQIETSGRQANAPDSFAGAAASRSGLVNLIGGCSGGKDYAGKPRPVVIVQDDSFDGTDSITVCAFTSNATEAPLFRLPVEPSERNGLRLTSRLMVDKITTVAKSKLGAPIGRLDDGDIVRLNQAMLVFLGLAVSPKVKTGD